jgi:hypothetical protein
MAGRKVKGSYTVDKKLDEWAGKSFKSRGYKSKSELVNAALSGFMNGMAIEPAYTLSQLETTLVKILNGSSNNREGLSVQKYEGQGLMYHLSVLNMKQTKLNVYRRKKFFEMLEAGR